MDVIGLVAFGYSFNSILNGSTYVNDWRLVMDILSKRITVPKFLWNHSNEKNFTAAIERLKEAPKLVLKERRKILSEVFHKF